MRAFGIEGRMLSTLWLRERHTRGQEDRYGDNRETPLHDGHRALPARRSPSGGSRRIRRSMAHVLFAGRGSWDPTTLALPGAAMPPARDETAHAGHSSLLKASEGLSFIS